MPVPGQNARDPDLVGDLRVRIAELEETCRHLRALKRADASICRDHAASSRALHKATLMLDRAERATGLGSCEWHAQTGRCVSASPGIKRLLGLDAKARLTAKRFADAIHPDDRPRYRELTRRQRRAGDRYVIAYRLVRSDGTTAEVREIGEPMPSLNGSAGTWLALVQEVTGQRETEPQLGRIGSVVAWDGGPAVETSLIDVTERVEAAAALKASEQRFRDSARASSDWFWETGPDHRFSWASDTTVDGWGARDVIGKTRRDLGQWDTDEAKWRDHEADLAAHRPFKDFRYRRHAPDSPEVYVSVSGVPVLGADGRFLGYRGTSTNVTAQVRAEREAARATALLSDAIDSVKDGLIMYDRDDRIVLVNDCSTATAADLEDVLKPGTPWQDLVQAQLDRGILKVPDAQRQDWFRELAEARKRGTMRCHQTADGRWFELRDHRTRSGGCVTIRADVTAFKQTEQALRESEQRFRDFAETSSDWFWESGPDHRFTWFSNTASGIDYAFHHMIGRTRAEVAQASADDPRWQDHQADLDAHRPFQDFRYLRPGIDGGDLFVSINGVPVRDAHGAFLGYRGTGKNITAEVLASQRVERSQNMLTDAIEAVADGFLIYDRDDRLVVANENCVKAIPRAVDLLQPGKTWLEIVRSQLERGVINVPERQHAAWLRAQAKIRRRGGVRRYQTEDGRWLELHDHRTRDGGCVSVRADVTELRQAQEALKASEQRFRDFAESSSDWFWEMGPDLRFTWFSHEMRKGTQIRARDLIGKSRREAGRLDVGDPEKWRAHLADLEAHRPFKDFRYLAPSGRGHEAYVSVSGVPMHDENGVFQGYRGTASDITAQVVAGQEMAEARAMLSVATESLRGGLAMFDRDDRLVLCNDGYRQHLAPIEDALGPDFTWPAMIRNLVEHGLIKPPPEGVEAYVRQQSASQHKVPCLRQVETSDGRFMEIRTYPARDGGFAVVRTDVTELRRAQQALEVSEQRFRDFAESSSDWFWELGPDLRFTWFSSPFLKGTGTDARTAIGKTPPEVVATDVDAQHWRDHQADLEAHRPFKDFRYRKRGPDGGDLYVSASGRPVFADDGAFLGYRGTGTSITAQVHAEWEVAKARALLADAVESITEGFAIFDAEDRLVLANQGYQSRLAPVADQLGEAFRWPEMMRALFARGLVKPPCDDPEPWIEQQAAAHHAGPCARQIETGDGRVIEIRSYPTRDGGFTSVRQDITALKRAEEKLKQSEQRFRSFAEASSDWFWEMGPDLRFTWFSTPTPGGAGLAAGDLIGQTRRLRVGSDTDESRRQAHLADLEARRPFKDFRYHVVSADGAASYLSVSGVPIFDAAGTFLGYRGTGKNVTAEVVAEQRATLAQTMLSDAIESIRGGFALYDRDDRLVLCNDSFRTTLAGISDLLRPGTAWETGFRALVDRGLIKVAGEDREAWLRQQIAMHGKAGCQRLLESSAGRWSDVREYPTRDGGLAIVRTDVTELKLAETALRESETLLKHAAQIADLGHWVWDAQANRCLHCSDGLARMYGITPGAYIARHGSERSGNTVIAEDKERYDEVISRATRLRKGYDIEFRELLADGTIRHMRERGEPVLDTAGTLVRMVGILQDITKHKRAEEALQRAQHELEMRVDERTEALRTANQALRREIVEHERTEEALRESRVLLEAIVETAAMGINVKDPSLRYMFMNAYQADVYGVSPERAVGKTPGELIGHDYGAYIEALDLRVLQSGKPLPYFEERIRDKDDVLRTWLTTKMPVGVGHNVLRYIVTTSLDITELKARERDLKQAQKMDAVGKLTGGIAHDFNNLLFVIRGNVALLKDEIRDSSAARECLGAIQDAAKLGADLTRSLLAFSRQQPLEPAVVNLPEVIAHTAATLLRPFEKSIDIQTSCSRRAWPVLIDRHQMENALLNLALNARDAMPNGGTLRIAVANHRSPKASSRHLQGLPPGEYVRLVVADSGVGMLPEVIDQAFEPFFTTKATGAGTGLGLSMVYGFIKQSGGYIDIESKLGQGTTITMHLPRTSGTEKKLEKAPDSRRWIAKGTETILITEDDAAVRRVAVRILTKLGYRSLEANNGPEALEILRSDAAVDLLFADIILSGEMNGAQLSREAQILRPDLKVLFASGYSEPAVLRDTEGADRVPLLSKPYDADELGRLIRGLLDDDRPPRKG